MGDRAVSSPVGVILIIGMTVASVTALFAVGGTVISDTRADAERSQMENAMSSFSSKASLVGLGESGDQRFSFGQASAGELSIAPTAGTVTLYINRTDGSGQEQLNSTSFGTVVYQSGDTEIAYQGGGVWERRGGTVQMISPPEYHYRLETLTFPIMTISGDGHASGSVRGTVKTGSITNDWFPIRGDENRTNPLEEGTILIEIESRYCEGWEAFFTKRSQGAIKEPCGGDETVTVDLTVPFRISGEEAVITKNIIHNAGDIPDEWADDVTAPSASSEVESWVELCATTGCGDIENHDPVPAGNYSVPDGHTLDGVTFDTTDGNITVVADGDLSVGDLSIEGEHDVTIYVRHDLEMDGGAAVNTDGNASQLRTLVHTDGDVEFSGSVAYTGILYAPGADLDMNGVPSMTYVGVLVVDTMETRGNINNFDFQPADDLEEYQLLGGDRPLTYLHVSENPVEIEFS